MVRRWAPLIWLAPDEQFLPGSVANFLSHVTPKPRAPSDSRRSKLPMGPDSKSWFLVTKSEVGECAYLTTRYFRRVNVRAIDWKFETLPHLGGNVYVDDKLRFSLANGISKYSTFRQPDQFSSVILLRLSEIRDTRTRPSIRRFGNTNSE